ncbi:DNA-binding response regulator [Paenibacillus sambharensis]|uniref:DNA-binding response regulator n=1 Tax=Paenibacillus sambharensis TaxID=1803190 RepID=A0A2W1L9J1_9BACL|nr:helix-turn-helix transcriptional regulator [Paenibacillus sambharensis]PZD96878.1 DNA-binding response regulator [Paenibacillus sambharensis]
MDRETYSLNSREREILLLVSQEKANKEIADTLNISRRMVEYYIASITHKFNVSTRVGAVVRAIYHKEIDMEEILTDR